MAGRPDDLASKVGRTLHFTAYSFWTSGSAVALERLKSLENAAISAAVSTRCSEPAEEGDLGIEQTTKLVPPL
ncbi:hypothetical protein AB8Z38_17810 [Bradyrhizobium sp. LLZ17]|uniref:Uncharacterized protein n=1 Tax=Bradyrhizobium sp. LLZ17 TaxID=3239388 RepID=A0AB39XW42_9BRAD